MKIVKIIPGYYAFESRDKREISFYAEIVITVFILVKGNSNNSLSLTESINLIEKKSQIKMILN